jgi:hypothetical protein
MKIERTLIFAWINTDSGELDQVNSNRGALAKSTACRDC